MTRNLAGQVIVITGASSGIGATVAVDAARAGMNVVLAARREDKMQQVASAIRANGGPEPLIVPTDVADAEQVQALIDATMDQFGRLDIMFANAGFGHYADVEQLNCELDRQMWDVNYFGTVHCIRLAAPIMKRQGNGHIVITSSVVAQMSLPFYSTYSATKAAQHALAMSLRLELAADHIDVTTVYPVGTRTEFFDVAAQLDGQEKMRQNTPKLFMQTSAHVSKRIMAALRRPRAEVWPSRITHFACALMAMFPWLRQASMAGNVKKYRHDAESESPESAKV